MSWRVFCRLTQRNVPYTDRSTLLESRREFNACTGGNAGVSFSLVHSLYVRPNDRYCKDSDDSFYGNPRDNAYVPLMRTYNVLL